MPKRIMSLCLFAILQFSAVLSHAVENSPNVIFDEGHGQLFSIDDTGDLKLSKLAETHALYRCSGKQNQRLSKQ